MVDLVVDKSVSIVHVGNEPSCMIIGIFSSIGSTGEPGLDGQTGLPGSPGSPGEPGSRGERGRKLYSKAK